MTEYNTISITELQQKAEEGDAQAQFELALRYVNGTDVEKNPELVFSWHKKGADQGHVKAQFALGLYYFLGLGQQHTQKLVNKWSGDKFIDNKVDPILDLAVSQAMSISFAAKNEDLAFAWFKKAAEQNCAEAQYWLAFCFSNGIGINTSDELAFEWYKKAADQGCADAQYSVACYYLEGKGIEQNNKLTLEWLTKAVEQDFAEGFLLLGALYHQGICVVQNDELAFEWFEKAAERGIAIAQFRLTQCYENGIGVERNYKSALDWCEKAAEQGYSEAKAWLSEQYFKAGLSCHFGKEGIEQNDELAFNWFYKAAELGYVDAYLFLGLLYQSGQGVVQSDELAFEWFNKAVEQSENIEGYSRIKILAMRSLATCYAQGKGVEKNEALAAQIYQRISPDELRETNLESLAGIMEMSPNSRYAKDHLPLILAIHKSNKSYDSARRFVEAFYDNKDGSEKNYRSLCLTYIDQAEELDKKNQELQEKNRQLRQAEKELEDIMSMFAHKFRSPLDAIIYNTTHDNQVRLYTEAAQTMRGLLDVFSIISTDPKVLISKLKQDKQGNGSLLSIFGKTLDITMMHLLSASATEKIQQHYLAYAKSHGLCAPELSFKSWYDNFYELEQQLQAEWEQSYAQLLSQATGLEERLAWLEQHFFKLEIKGFDDADIHFKEFGFKESFLTILLNEILVNAFKYYSSPTRQAVVLEWAEHKGHQVLICRNPSTRSERTIIKGSRKGHTFLSVLARKTGSQFAKPTLQDDFVVEFGIPNELLLCK